jgi:DNA-binding Xre family transcriptional regulator
VKIVYLLDDLMREYRRGHPDVTWKDVAEATGISQQLISNLRHSDGSLVTNMANVAAICSFFRRPIEDVVRIELPENPEEVHVDVILPGRRTPRRRRAAPEE